VLTGNTTTLSVFAADDHGEAALKYTWAATVVPAGVSPADVLFSVNGVNGAKNTVATLPADGDYTFTVTITDTANQSITSTVAVSAGSPPAVGDIAYDFHDKITVSFTKDVSASLDVHDLSVLPAGAPADAEPISPADVTWDKDTLTATFTFATPFADGDYVATLAASGVTDAPGRQIPADRTYDFFAMGGDINRDRAVDFADLVVLAQNYNSPDPATYATGDLTGDGLVDFNDLVVLAQHYNTSLTPAGAAAPIAGAAPMPALSTVLAQVTPVTTTTTATPKKKAPTPVFSITPVAKPKPAPKPVRRR
jgi:hypothetical protein